MRPVSKAEFARERDVSRTRVYQWLGDGRIVALDDGRIDADDAHARLNAQLDQAKGIRRDGNITSSGPSSLPAGSPGDLLTGADRGAESPAPAAPKRGGGDEGYWADKAREQKAVAALAEMKALTAAGALVPAADVRKEAMDTARKIRNALLAIPDQVAQVLDPANPARAHKLLTSEIAKVLREIGAGLEQRAAADPGLAEREAALQ